MATPVLATKLYIPPPGPRTIARQRLIDRLDQSVHHKLTLISAPAGSGKTTLVSSWLADRNPPVAWLSLDEADNDPTRFLRYVITTLQSVIPDLGSGLLDALQSTQPPPPGTLLTALTNELASLREPVVLVLDDYHSIDAPAVDATLTRLLEHLPPHLHLVMTTREDPQVPLARMRARGQLLELRAADLKFTADEATTFLNEMMSLDLAAPDIAVLEARTEGWIAGLQLAALSMHGQTDTAEFIRAFSGSHRFVMDYLVDEVLQRQPATVQAFLLQTSILDRLTCSLCDTIMETPPGSGQDTLEHLERTNLFLVPLDNERQWYRYHHLFADLLRQRLHHGTPAASGQVEIDVPELHRRASHWYEQHGSAIDAIRHALASDDAAHAATLIERWWPDLQRARQEMLALEWLKSLPGDLLPDRPVLSVVYAGALLGNGETEGVEALLLDAERWLDQANSTSTPVIADHEAFHQLPGSIRIYRSAIALSRGDVQATMHHARAALEVVPENAHLLRGAASALLGLASWTTGDLDTAYDAHATGMEHLRQAGNIADVVGGSLALADIRLTQGRLRQAEQIYRQELQRAASHGQPAMRGTADMYVGLGDLARERNDLDAAARYLNQSLDLGEHIGFPQHHWRWRVVLARIRQAQGELDAALNLLVEAEQRYVPDFYPPVRPVSAMIARVHIAQGHLDDALAWARDRGLTGADDLHYMREFEHITLARLLIARHHFPEALSLLERLRQAAETGERIGSAIEILVLQALAYAADGDTARALEPLRHALTLAEPEGYIRIFIDEGRPMAHLLSEAAARRIAPVYTATLLGAVEPQSSGTAGLLSERELEVLQLIMHGLSNREIGERLYLALDTVKGHNRRIFAKLQVESRTAAIARARELGLTGP